MHPPDWLVEVQIVWNLSFLSDMNSLVKLNHSHLKTFLNSKIFWLFRCNYKYEISEATFQLFQFREVLLNQISYIKSSTINTSDENKINNSEWFMQKLACVFREHGGIHALPSRILGVRHASMATASQAWGCKFNAWHHSKCSVGYWWHCSWEHFLHIHVPSEGRQPVCSSQAVEQQMMRNQERRMHRYLCFSLWSCSKDKL